MDTRIFELFLAIVEYLMDEEKTGGKKIYAEDSKRKYFFFHRNAFVRVLEWEYNDFFSGKRKISDILRQFRTLGLIVCDPNRFTKTTRVNGKFRKAIAVEKEKFQALKALKK